MKKYLKPYVTPVFTVIEYIYNIVDTVYDDIFEIWSKNKAQPVWQTFRFLQTKTKNNLTHPIYDGCQQEVGEQRFTCVSTYLWSVTYLSH